jgi:pyruvate/2-oxoglutarate dehydrogenase complex dihydrolipoamide dehydrogenase (E3) component
VTVRGAATLQVEDEGLLSQVRPAGWVNPRPSGKYDLVVLGGGTAGLVAAVGAARLGARIALVERHRLGGDCLNTGCVPSKAMLRSARALGELRRAAALGVHASAARVDFPAVMRRVGDRRRSVAEHDSAARLSAAGVDVFFGHGCFADRRTVAVDQARLSFRRALVATGSRPATPPIPGLERVRFLTSESVFEITELPVRLTVLGAGPMGCELAQAFARFGAQVTVVDQAEQVLPREDPAAAALVRQSLERDGVQFVLGASVTRIDEVGSQIRLLIDPEAVGGSRQGEVRGEALLVAAGRAPNVEGLGLEAAGVDYSKRGVLVNDRLQSSNRRIFASGDVCSAYQFTHAADAQSRLVLQNALFFGRRRASSLVIPWVTFTDPELAHVGVTHADAAASAGRISSVTVDLCDVDRAIVDDETDGFVRVYHEGGRLRGCTIVARHAGEAIAEAAYALTHGGSLSALSSTVHAYPTQAEALRKAGDAYRRQKLTPGFRRWLQRYFEWTR